LRAENFALPLQYAHHAPQTTDYGGIMEIVRQSWTDDRLDDLREEVVDFRRETHEEFVTVRREMKDEFRAVRREMKEEFRLLHGRFDATHRIVIRFQGLMIAALIGFIATQV
jgi:hypothetical protein